MLEQNHRLPVLQNHFPQKQMKKKKNPLHGLAKQSRSASSKASSPRLFCLTFRSSKERGSERKKKREPGSAAHTHTHTQTRSSAKAFRARTYIHVASFFFHRPARQASSSRELFSAPCLRTRALYDITSFRASPLRARTFIRAGFV